MSSNEFYDHGTFPSQGALLSSSAMRAALDEITTGFDKMPTLTGNGNKLVVVNAGGTALSATATPVLGTPASGTLTNCTGLPIATGVSGLGTGVASALAVNTGSAGSVLLNAGALATPSSGTLTNCAGLPIATGVSGLGTGVATALAVNVGSAGAVITFNGAAGTPSSGTLTNCTGLPIATGVSGLGTNVATALAVNVGSAGALVVNGGAAGTPSSGALTNCTGLPVSTGLAGTGTGVTDALAQNVTGSGGIVLATTPTLVTPVLGVATATSINKVAFTAPATGSTVTIADGKTLTVSNSITFAGTDSTTMTFPGASASIGYLGRPQNSQGGDYTLVLADASKQLYMTATGKTFTIPANASVAYPVGTEIEFVNGSTGTMSISVTSDTIYLAGTSTTGTRTVAQKGVARARKVTSTVWIVEGTGVT